MSVLRHIPKILISAAFIAGVVVTPANSASTANSAYQSKRPGAIFQLIRDVRSGGGGNGRSENICWSSCFNNYNGCLEVSDKPACVSRMKNCLAVCDKLSGNPNL